MFDIFDYSNNWGLYVIAGITLITTIMCVYSCAKWTTRPMYTLQKEDNSYEDPLLRNAFYRVRVDD